MHDYHELLNSLEKVDKEQMYKFVKENCYHGADPTDEQLEEMLQALHKSDEKSFIEAIINITAESQSLESESIQTKHFYTVHALHGRYDKFGEKFSSNLKGKTVNSSFNATLLVKNYRECLDTLPDHVAIRSIEEVKSWAKSIQTECLHPNGVEPFYVDRPNSSRVQYNCFMENEDDRFRFSEAVRNIDWENATFDVFASISRARSILYG